jgi:hypothetical protein
MRIENRFQNFLLFLEQEVTREQRYTVLRIENSFPDCSALLEIGSNARTGLPEDREQFPVCAALLGTGSSREQVGLRIENSFPDCYAILGTGNSREQLWTEDRENFSCLLCSYGNRNQARTVLH